MQISVCIYSIIYVRVLQIGEVRISYIHNYTVTADAEYLDHSRQAGSVAAAMLTHCYSALHTIA